MIVVPMVPITCSSVAISWHIWRLVRVLTRRVEVARRLHTQIVLILGLDAGLLWWPAATLIVLIRTLVLLLRRSLVVR